MDKSKLQNHKDKECPRRITKCKFCPLDMPYIEIWSHEQTCGAKTNKCDKCNQWIKKSDWDNHYPVCGLKDVSPPPNNSPYKSPFNNTYNNNNNRKPTFGDFIPCPYCSDPFEEFDDLQVHILITHPTEANFTEGDNNQDNKKNEENQDNQPQQNNNTNEENNNNENKNENVDMDTTNDN